MCKVAMLALAAVVAGASILPAGAAGNLGEGKPAITVQRFKNMLMARGGTCKTVSSCEEAVELWCGGYSRADGDGDGIPCENLCRSRSQVDSIKQKVGC
jgi:Excalibur calcium-binding domain